MKKALLSVAVLATLGASFQACNVKDDLIDKVFQAFITKTADFNVTIPAVTATSDYITLGTQTVHYDLDSAIQAETGNVFNVNSIDKVFAEELVLTLNGTTANVDAPDNENSFANFEKGKVTFYSSSNATPVSFEVTNIPNQYATTLSIPVDKTLNLKSYFVGSELYYTVSGKIRKATTHGLKCNVVVKFKIEK